MNLHIPESNTKLGKVPNISLTPGKTCSPEACSTCLTHGCYANKFYKMYPRVRNAWDDNTGLAKYDLEEMEKQLHQYFGSKSTFNPLFRLHVGGDFVSKRYAEMWNRVMSKYREIKFLAFTKRFDIAREINWPENGSKNASVVLSAWPGKDVPSDLSSKYPVAYVQDGTVTNIPQNAISCNGGCDKCGKCWDLAKNHQNVVFHKH